MRRPWRIVPHDAARIEQLERAARVPPVVAQLLLARGVSAPDAARDFLDARLTGLRDPEQLPGAAPAAELVHQACQSGERIVIFGDYDADGMTGTAILYACLKLLRADVRYHIPNRMTEGYGLNAETLERLHADGARLVISVDCGVSANSAIARARQLGMRVVVTDHHQPGATLPPADAIVHPGLPGRPYPFTGICGAGVALKLAWAICQKASGAKRVTDRLRQFLMTALGLAAVGTVADVVPLLDENRLIVKHGLMSLKRNPPLGVAALMRISGVDQKPRLSSEDIAFVLAPRLNAAGRLGQATLGVELLTTTSRDRAEALAEYLHELNKNRDSLERSIYLSARKQIKERFDEAHDPAFVIEGRGWHPGVIGIVAGRLAEKLHAPVVLIATDQAGAQPGVGSARAAGCLNLYAALSACGERLSRFGGHAQAAGLTIEEQQIDAFRDAFCDYAASEIQASRQAPELHVDGEAPFSQLTLGAVRHIETLAPFGAGNPRPVLCAEDVELASEPKLMGGGDRHLTVRLKQHGVDLRAVAFGQAEWLQPLAERAGPIQVAYRPAINHFRGFEKVELQLVDWRPSEPS